MPIVAPISTACTTHCTRGPDGHGHGIGRIERVVIHQACHHKHHGDEQRGANGE